MINTKEIAEYHIDVILTKMFEAVGLDWKNPEVKADYRVFDKESEWYARNEWTAKQEAEFGLWLTEYLYGSAGARKALMGYSVKNKKRCRDAAMIFTSWYGWKTKKEQ
jgi:hypothetical protein